MQKEIAGIGEDPSVSFLDDVDIESDINFSIGQKISVYVEDFAVSAVLAFVALCVAALISFLSMNIT